jgi:hypothetical protein
LQSLKPKNSTFMKKAILFFAMALATATGVYAQKQTGGEKNLEVQFAPLGGNPVSISGIRFRMFNSESSAIRVGLFVGGSSEKEVTAQADEDADSPELYTTNKTFDFAIRPGYEKHFAGTERLSPYIGGEILFAMSSETEEVESWDTEDGEDYALGTTTTKNGSTTFGVNAVAGMDFYFTNSLYLGAEIGFGFANTSDRDTEVTYEGPIDADDVDPTLNGSSMGWGPNFQGSLRLGWLFN